MALATGGRISESHALIRGPQGTRFTEAGHMVVVPDPTFLAKNEPPNKRRQPLIISPLPVGLEDIFPVHTVKQYLERTKNFTEGALFRNSKTGSPVSLKGFNKLLLSVIKQADPPVFP